MIIDNSFRKEYIRRINQVIDYVEQHIDMPVNLDDMAREACFSPFHFHRIFTLFVGETPNNFIRRIRVEKAASILISQQDRAISDVAISCGFNSSSVFCRVFKEHFGTTANNYRISNKDYISKIRQSDSNIGKSENSSASYISDDNINQWRYIMKNIEVKQMPELNVVYCRHTGAFDQIGLAYEKLFKWSGPRGLLRFPETKTLTVYHDDPKVTKIENVRQSACITVDEDVKTDGEIGKMNVSAGTYAVGRFEISVIEFEKAWNDMCIWVADSGYQPDEGYPYELYHNDHTQHPEQKFILDICVPVKPL